MKTQTVIVNQNPEAPIAAEILAVSIQQIAAAMQAINRTRITRKAILALIHDQSRIAKRDIEIVLNNLEELERDWLKRPSPPLT